jgi:nucleoside-diphosphate-sugar epimerase
MQFLVTGATGFMGPHLIKRLAADGHRCRCLVRTGSNTKPLEALGVEWVRGDITQAGSIHGIADNTDVVLHLATLGHMSNFAVTEDMFRAINIEGTRNVMQEALRAKAFRVVHCSTVAAMGICPDNPATEMSRCNPHHPYGRSKLEAERVVLELAKNQGLPAVIVRFSMVYGPGDPRDILKLARLAKKGLFPKIGRRAKLTPLIHVSDAVNGLLLAADKGRLGHLYLLTNPESLPFDAIRRILQKALGVTRPPLYVPEWAAIAAAACIEKSYAMFGKTPPVSRKNIESTLADRVFSIEKARTELDFNPRIDPVAGLSETVKWYRENQWI